MVYFAKIKSLVGVEHSAFFKPRVQALKRYGPHNWDFVQVAVGILLSDGYAEVHGNGVRITFQQEKPNVIYFLYVLKFLYKRGYVSSMKSKPYYRVDADPITGVKRNRIYYRLHTFTFGSLLWLRNLFYDARGVKIIRPELEQFLSPIALAHFICGDGSISGYGVTLHVNSFTHEHCTALSGMLERKFGLACSVHSAGIENQFRIYIKAQSMSLLRSLVLPHMPHSMHYKLGL